MEPVSAKEGFEAAVKGAAAVLVLGKTHDGTRRSIVDELALRRLWTRPQVSNRSLGKWER